MRTIRTCAASSSFWDFISLSCPCLFTVAMIATAEKFSAALKRSPRLMRIMDWTFAGIIGGFALRIATAASR